MHPCQLRRQRLKEEQSMRRRSAPIECRARVTWGTFTLLLGLSSLGCAQEQPTCSFVPKAAADAEWDCAAMAGTELVEWDVQQAAQFAVKHSPIIYMHPAEEYVLTDPRMYWRAAHLYNQYYQRLNKTTVMAAVGLQEPTGSGPHTKTRVDVAMLGHLAYSFLTILPTEPDEAIKPAQRALVHGSPIDAKGRSSARVFYQLMKHNGAWVYTYNLYYAWNGCGNLAFVTPDGHGSSTHTLEFISCPDSVHESDWERVSMVVCPTSKGGMPVAALLSQHNHHRLLNCSKPLAGGSPGATECDWRFGDDGHPHLAVYSALHSHANFPSASNASICGQITNSKDGTFFLDRTADGGPMFVPNATNVLPLPGLVPGLASDPEDEEWASYPGWWGTAEWKLPGRSITCLSSDRNRKVACPDNPAWRIVAGQAGIPAHRRGSPAHDTGVMQPYLDLPDDPQAIMPFDYHKLGGAKQGPAFRPWAHHWVGAKNPPLWELPLATLVFRFALNNGQTIPSLDCFNPMVASDDAQAEQSHGPPLELGADPWGALLLLLTIPITLFTASAIKHTLDPPAPPPFATAGASTVLSAPPGSPLRPSSVGGSIRLPSLLSARQHSALQPRTSSVVGWWTTWMQRWSRPTISSSGAVGDLEYAGDYQPVATAAAEVELGGVAAAGTPSTGLRRHSQTKGAHQSPAGPLLDDTSPHATSQGGGVSAGGVGVRPGGAPVAGGARGRLWQRFRCAAACVACMGCTPVLMRKQNVICMASCTAWIMYAVGLSKSFGMLEESLPVLTPLLTILYILLQTAAAVLAAIDTYHSIVQPRYVPPGGTLPLPSSHGSWHEAPEEDDDEEDVLRPESFGMETVNGRRGLSVSVPAVGAGVPGTWGRLLRQFGVLVHRVVHFAGPGLATTLLVAAVVLLVLLCVMQGVCRELIFSHISINPPTTAAGIVGSVKHHPHHSHPNHEVLEPGAAAVLLPIGAVNGAEFPARLYVASLCIGWRERFGGGLLAIGSLIWSVVHLVWERHKQ